jgi:hypothetical protein
MAYSSLGMKDRAAGNAGLRYDRATSIISLFANSACATRDNQFRCWITAPEAVNNTIAWTTRIFHIPGQFQPVLSGFACFGNVAIDTSLGRVCTNT